ncbi:MAG: hypothetical protein M1511_05910, partial [Deltaproteobacteria bacterium]|nr:hypothetical protein [Deltaproteobacteria bacterium]
ANTPPECKLDRRNWFFGKGGDAASKSLKAIRLDNFKAEVGALLDQMGSNDCLPLDNPLWIHVIKQEFSKLPGLQIPEPFEFPNDDTLFFQKGFTKEIRRVMKLTLQVN